jgi:hypothetical protein
MLVKYLMKGTSFGMMWYCIGRRVRACTKLTEAAKALATRDHVRGISGPSALSNNSYDDEPLESRSTVTSDCGFTSARSCNTVLRPMPRTTLVPPSKSHPPLSLAQCSTSLL